MADSVITGVGRGGVETLPPEAKKQLDDILPDLSEEDKALIDRLGDGSTLAVGNIGSATYVHAETGDGEVFGRLIGSTTGRADGDLSDTVMQMQVDLPLGVGLSMQGPSQLQTAIEANDYFGNLIDTILPAGFEFVQDSWNASVSQATQQAERVGGPATAVRMVSIDDGAAAGAQDLIVSGSGAVETVVLNMFGSNLSNLSSTDEATRGTAFENGVQAGHTIKIQDIDSAVILGNGKVNVLGSSDTYVVGDAFNQDITGSAGNDTLIGGGGSDTLKGGSGADTFGIDFKGDALIRDFDGSEGDMLSFGGGVTLRHFLQADITDIAAGPFSLGGINIALDGHNITLVGITADQLTLDMLKFDL